MRGVQRFHELLAADPRVDATTIQTVGQKGYDGFSIVLVNDYQNEAESMASSSSSSGLV